MPRPKTIQQFFSQQDYPLPRIHRNGPPKPYQIVHHFSNAQGTLWAGRKASGFCLIRLTMPDETLVKTFQTSDPTDFDYEVGLIKSILRGGS